VHPPPTARNAAYRATATAAAAQVLTACDVGEPDAGLLQLSQDPQLVCNPPPPAPLSPGDDLHPVMISIRPPCNAPNGARKNARKIKEHPVSREGGGHRMDTRWRLSGPMFGNGAGAFLTQMNVVIGKRSSWKGIAVSPPRWVV
jgi:hypothetical protein